LTPRLWCWSGVNCSQDSEFPRTILTYGDLLVFHVECT
jgi:hypothetical protein